MIRLPTLVEQTHCKHCSGKLKKAKLMVNPSIGKPFGQLKSVGLLPIVYCVGCGRIRVIPKEVK